jgi:ABC-type ATPase involved in cell division
MKTLSGLHPPSEGELIFEGETVHFSSPKDARDRGIEMVYQDLALAGNMNIAENIYLGREPRRNILRGVLDLVDHKASRKLAEAHLDNLQIHVKSVSQKVEELSGGQRQAVAIARATAFQAKVVIMDESTGKARADGSRAGLTACGLNIVAEQTGEWDRAKGLAVMENIITGNPNIKAVFASNDNMALGAAEALKSAGMLKDVVLVGFDANPDAAESVLAGEMSATVAQNPSNMGAFGVESVLKLIKGGKLPAVIDTGTVLVTSENASEFK